MEISDDLQLLKLMMSDLAQAPAIYKTTNYWDVYQRRFVPELETLGLKDFRRRKKTVLSAFGATDFPRPFWQIDLSEYTILNNSTINKIPYWLDALNFCNRIVNKIVWMFTVLIIGKEEFKMLCYQSAFLQGKKLRAKPLSAFSSSLVGNPEDVINVEGNTYTTTMLYYYLRYVYCSQFIDFNSVKVIVELGSGAGKQVEVLKKLYPDICFLLFDIPPQLYVCQQYLKAVFPGDVVGYQETKHMESMPQLQKGKIFMFGNWKFPLLKNANVDLFWNATSLQETEPEVVATYLSYVNNFAKNVFLQEMMAGKEIAKHQGQAGVLRPTILQDYQHGLSNFKMINISSCIMPLGKVPGHSDSFWKKIS